MANHPYISGAGNITQMIGFLKKNFPATVTSDTVKKYGLASKNESYVINALQFLGLIDEEGKRQEHAHDVLTTHDEEEFKAKFAELVKKAYKELFDLYGDEAWTLSKPKLIGYFRQADKTSDIIGTRQAAVFQALRGIAGFEAPSEAKPKVPTAKKPKAKPASAKPAEFGDAEVEVVEVPPKQTMKTPAKSDMALTVRIEINLPAEGSQETYDAIFKSIKANLYPS
jgi:hypothetical protein